MDIHRPELKQQRQRRKVIWIGLAVVAVFALLGLSFTMEPALPSVPSESAWLGMVERGDFMREVRGPGSLVPREVRWIAAISEGRVERILAKPGIQVEPDTVLAELSNPELVQQLEEARWAAQAAQADLNSLAAELDRALLDAQAALAELNADSQSSRLQADAEKTLSEKGVVSAIQYQQTELRAQQLATRVELEQQRITRLDSSHKAQLAAQQARVEQAERLIERRQQQVDALTIRAGIVGVLQEVAVETGQQIQPGGSIARVAQVDDLIAELRIPETQAREIGIDQPVRIDTRNEIIAGRVIRVDPGVQNGSVLVDVELLDPLPPGSRPDLSVDGTIELERLENVLHVARPATGQPESRTNVFVLIDNETAERIQIELGRASVGRIEVISGLEVGQRIILSDMSRWSEHDRVRLD